MVRTSARRVCLWLALGVMLFAIYASLLPFELQARPIGDAWSSFVDLMRVAPERVSRTNFLANILLFVPVGFGLMGALLAGKPRRIANIGVALTVLVLSVTISVLAEFLQIFAPGRVPSRADVLAQALGCVAGIGAWMWAGPPVIEWFQTQDRHQTDRINRVLVGYSVIWFLAGLAPFDATVDVGELGQRLRSGMINLVPFASHVSPTRQAWDAFADAASSIPLGLLGLVGWRRDSTRRSVGAAWAMGAAAVVSLEAAQVFIQSHSADINDVLFGCLGVAVGVWAGGRAFSASSAPDSAATTAPRWAVALLGVWCAVVCAFHWQPFDFGIDRSLMQAKLARISIIPFNGYRVGNDLNAFNDILAKAAVAMPLGLFAAFAARAWHIRQRLQTAGWIAVALLVFGLVEIGQFFVPSRFPDPTDVLVGVAASLAGLVVGRWLQRKR